MERGAEDREVIVCESRARLPEVIGAAVKVEVEVYVRAAVVG